MGLTNAQQAAIEQSGKTVLVSAAAGSGKTFTLTKRIIQKIIEEGADISRMLIVTYTRAAAGELKSRISSALSEEIAKYPENTHLQNQMLLIPSAKICTIDSFFTDPVKSNFDKLGLPARIRLADSSELEDLRVDIFSSVLEDMYAKYGITSSTKLSDITDRNEFTDLIYLLTNTRNTHKFISLLCDLYDRLVTSPLGVEVLKKNALRLEESAKLDFFSTPEGSVIKRDILQILGTCENAFKYNLSRLDEDAFVKEKYFANFEDNVRKCQNLAHRIEKSDFEHLSNAFEAYNPSKLATITKENATPFSEECKEFRKKTHQKVMKIKNDYLAYSVDEIKNTYIELSKINLLLYEIISIFDKKYTQSKKDSGMLEFSDMPRFLLELLGDGSTSVAKEMRDMYDEVYIDEYQDVNEIQDTIFKIIGGTHRFMVGDIKQSIYGFRDAMPELFAAYKNTFPLYTENIDSDGCTIFMSENFRCDENIINFTNAVCSKLFEASREAINYTKNDDLVFQKMGLPEDYECPDIEINIFDDGQYSNLLIENEDEEDPAKPIVSEDDVRDTDIPNEAVYCAKEILRLIREEKKPNGAPVSFGDIAILVRVKYHGPIIAAALKKYGIEYCLSASNQLFDGNDMKSLLDLLRVIDNPEDDMALCSFLTTDAYSGEPMFSLEEIVTIRQAAGTQKSMYRALVEYSDTSDPLATLLCHRVSIILNILKSLRALSRRVAVDKLLRSIKTLPEFSLICESEAYTYIYDCACNYVKRSWNGLYSFLKYYKKLAESGNVTLKEASSTNAVNIMTIHQSKGLEYHTVFLFGCSRQFSQKESRASLNYSRQLCVATKTLLSDVDEDGKTYVCGTSSNIIKSAVVKSIYNDSLLEEMRILYVGLTRARERLYISATIKEEYGDFSNRMKMIGCDPSSIMKQKSFIEWIFSSLTSQNAPKDLRYNVNVYSALKMPDLIPADHDESKPMISATESELSLVNAINSTSNVSEGEKLISLIPSKVAASKASPSMLDNTIAIHKNALDSDREAEAIRARIQLMSSSKKDFDSILSEAKAPSAADIGTATHSFLQLCDFERVRKTSIKEEIELLVECKFISRECADMINTYQIKKFFESKLFCDIQKANDLRKEFKFGIYRPASEFTNDASLSKIFANRNIYVQGAIDLILFFPDGSIHVCDYKTDRLEAGEKENISLFCKRMRDRHKDQLYQYKVAIEQIFGRSPDKMYIYSLPLGETVEINV